MIQGKVFKVREGKFEKWKAWCFELQNILHHEAISTLKEERVMQEGCMAFEINGACYVIGFMEGKHMPAAAKDINIQHRAMIKECLERICEAKTLYHLKTD